MIGAGTLRDLPKAELHQHLDGALLPATAVELAADARIPLTLSEATTRLVAPVRCRNQAELLTYFDLPLRLLQTAGGLRRAAAELVDQMTDDGVTYAEIRWAPLLHLDAGLSVDAVLEAVADGVASAHAPNRPVVSLIVTAMRSHPPDDNVALARTAAAFGPPIVAFDLAGPEAAFPASPHTEAFRVAAAGGLSLTAHAGEVAGTERIREVLALDVARIAHGVTLAQDAELVARARELDVTLDMCPTSNVQAGIVASVEAHPFAKLHRSGVSVTLSTDDRTVSNTTLSAELARCAAAGGLTPGELADIAINGYRRAFAPRRIAAPLEHAARAAWEGWVAGVSRPPTEG
ncbi:MAG: adenosine deaminase [Candidatus Limnocylindria bacterium]